MLPCVLCVLQNCKLCAHLIFRFAHQMLQEGIWLFLSFAWVFPSPLMRAIAHFGKNMNIGLVVEVLSALWALDWLDML